MLKTEVHTRSNSYIFTIVEDETGIGSILITRENVDLIPILENAIKQFNERPDPDAAKTVTGRNERGSKQDNGRLPP